MAGPDEQPNGNDLEKLNTSAVEPNTEKCDQEK